MSTLEKIKTTTTVLMVLVTGFWLYWSISALGWGYDLAWADQILRWRIVENHMTITPPVRLALGAMWLVVFTLGQVCFYYAIRLLLCFFNADLFHEKTCRMIRYLGLALVAAMIGDTLYASFDHVVATWNNTNQALTLDDGRLSIGRPFVGPRFEYDPGDITVLLCGLAFCMIGWIFEEGLRMQAENKEFI